jgi:hypothetical protein
LAFSILAVGGAFAQRRWGWRASVAVVVLSWPVFVTAVLLSELRTAPQLLELNSFAVLLRNLWVPPTLATAALAVSLWLVRRATSSRRLVLQGIGAGAVWAFVMPVPLALIAIALARFIPEGTAEYHYVDFRPMARGARERFRLRLPGGGPCASSRARRREAKWRSCPGKPDGVPDPRDPPGSPPFELDAPGLGRCAFSSAHQRDNTISIAWSTLPGLRGVCYGEGAQDAEVTFRFAGSETSLTLRGAVVKGGEYYFYDSL